MRKKIVIGNWKMNPESGKLADSLYKNILKNKLLTKKVEVILCPPLIYLERLRKISKIINFGVQNISSEDRGAYTGEVSGSMLYDIGARYVIIGHSERRIMGEKNQLVNKKIKMALASSLFPILCVGENTRDENHDYFKIIQEQIEDCLFGINKNSFDKIVIAYEPVWAIGKDALREATPEEFREVSVFIKKILSDKLKITKAKDVRVIYGGSVHAKNAKDFIIEGQADGFLVGRDSLDAKKFSEIIKITENAVN